MQKCQWLNAASGDHAVIAKTLCKGNANLHAQAGETGEIPAWPIEARNQTKLDRVASERKDDWNLEVAAFREPSRRAANCNDNGTASLLQG